MARDFNMELLNYPSPYPNGIVKNAVGHIPRTPPPSPPQNAEDCRVPPISLEDIPEFLLCKDSGYLKVLWVAVGWRGYFRRLL